MSRKASTKKATKSAATKTTTKKSTTKKKPAKSKSAAKSKGVIVYTAQRLLNKYDRSYTEPDRIFADKTAAQLYADERNRELRAITNPFHDCYAHDISKGGQKALVARVKKLKLKPPTKKKGEWGVNWEAWWDDNYFNMTDDQRDAIWERLTEFNFYQVTTTTMEE